MKSVAVIPAAGVGSRLQPLPCSKEMLPLGYVTMGGKRRICPVSLHLVQALAKAEVKHMYFIVNSNKTDIPRYYGNGEPFGVHISYLHQTSPRGLVDALAQATPWISDQDDTLIFFGMPDTIFQPPALYSEMKKAMQNSDLSVVLGVFPVKSWWKFGMTYFSDADDGHGISEVIDITEKPQTKPGTDYAWGAAVWTTAFHKYLTRHLQAHTESKELLLSEVFLSAKADGMKIGCLVGDRYADIGTIEELEEVAGRMNRKESEKEWA